MLVGNTIIAQYISLLIADKLNIELSQVKPRMPLFSFGVSSLVSEEIRMALSQSYSQLSSTFLFEYPTIEKMATYLSTLETVDNSPIEEAINDGRLADIEQEESSDNASEQSQSQTTIVAKQSDTVKESIAIIGISGQFPKSADPEALWQNLINQNDCVTTVPTERWDVESMFSNDHTDRGALFGKWGGFLEGIEYFDPEFFQISHREAELIDPQQKLFLQCGWS